MKLLLQLSVQVWKNSKIPCLNSKVQCKLKITNLQNSQQTKTQFHNTLVQSTNPQNHQKSKLMGCIFIKELIRTSNHQNQEKSCSKKKVATSHKTVIAQCYIRLMKAGFRDKEIFEIAESTTETMKAPELK